MASPQEDIASLLLHSTDTRIAEAAKRVFSSTYPVVSSTTQAHAHVPAAPTTTTAFHTYNRPASGFHHAANQLTRQEGGIPPSVGIPVIGRVEHTATNNPPRDPTMMDDLHDDNDDPERKPSSTERLQRSRERNRLHARKTRQRKKEHMQKLQNRADELKLEQIRLKQAINEKNTASILVGLFSGDGTAESENAGIGSTDPMVDALLKRSTEDIPDSSKIPELPALILPGQHNSKKKSSSDDEGATALVPEELQEDGIDYALLGKDRSACSPAELDQIRRERNRMHAKRTRDRKRIFMEEMEVMIKQLEDENALLQVHMNKLNENLPSDTSALSSNHVISPLLGPVVPATAPAPAPLGNTAVAPPSTNQDADQTKGDFLNQIESLLAAAGAFEKRKSLGEINAVSCAESDVTASTNHSEHNSLCEEDYHSGSHPSKKPRIEEVTAPVPSSITTTNITHL